MRLSALILAAALGVVALTPAESQAQRRAAVRWANGYYAPAASYYYPSTSYYSGYDGYYSPGYSSGYYYSPGVSSSYYVDPGVSSSYYPSTSYYYPSTGYYPGYGNNWNGWNGAYNFGYGTSWGQYIPGSGYYMNRFLGGWR